MTYEQAVAFWLGRIDYERRQPRQGDLKLDRMRELAFLLGNPQNRIQHLHIAGTKGKGSSAAFTAQILQQAGYKTGLFTSPHLVDLSERIRINGVPISKPAIASGMARIAEVCQQLDQRGPEWNCTFFEIITALGFLHFAQEGCDFAVIEVGLGGRLDSTNILMPRATMISTIGFDHMAILGNTLAQIAAEKAGIIKPHIPVICTAEAEEARQVIEQVAHKQNAPLCLIHRDFESRYLGQGKVEMTMDSQREYYQLGLRGAHQALNAAGARMLIRELQQQGYPISPEAITEGLRTTFWPARLEIVRQKPFTVLDCAHNVPAIETLLATLSEEFPQVPRWNLIFASSIDKQIPEMLERLAGHFERYYLTTFQNNPRAATPQQLEQMLPHRNRLRYSLHHSSQEAWAKACEETGPDEGILITGSVFLAGELRNVVLLGSEREDLPLG